MKKVLFLLFAGVIAFASCSKDETTTTSDSQEVSVSSVPPAITLYVVENYPDAEISTIYKLSNSDTTYAVTLNTSELLAFDGNGLHMGHGEPGLCGDSTGWNHGDSTGWHHGDSTGGHHGGGHHGGGHHGGGHHGGGNPGGISPDSIPAAIAAYVTANYSGYTIHHAWNDTLCQFGTVIGVMIDSTHAGHLKLVFDVNGQFLANATRMEYADLSETVKAAVAANYSAYTARHMSEAFTLADGTRQYKVFLFMETTRINVVMNEEGIVVCEQ
jgi:hypothetical protein